MAADPPPWLMYQDEDFVICATGTFETYEAEGDMLYKNGECRKAIQSFTTALEFRPGDRDCLVARSKCFLKLGDTTRALNDAETSLRQDKNYHRGLFQKAEVLYSMGDFEMALVFYHRGHKLRPELEVFRLGIQKAREAIDNSVGSPLRVTLTKDGDLSYFEKIQRRKSKPSVAVRTLLYRSPSSRLRDHQQSVGSEKTIKTLLGELYGDKVFLEKILKEADTSSKSTQAILELVRETLAYLDSRGELWRQQKPVYARQRERSERQTKNGLLRGRPTHFIMNEYQQIQVMQTQGKFEESLRRVKKTLKTVDAWPRSRVPELDEIRGNLHSFAGVAYMEIKDYKQAAKHHDIDLRLAKENDFTEAKSRALDNLGRVSARCGQYRSAIDFWMEKLPLAENHLEETWLYHEIGRCHLELEEYEAALTFGQKSMSAAVEAKDNVWRLNACVLMAQAEVKLAHLQKSLELFSKAKDLAKITYDYDAEKAIKKATAEVTKQLRHLILRGPSDSVFKNKKVDNSASEISDALSIN